VLAVEMLINSAWAGENPANKASNMIPFSPFFIIIPVLEKVNCDAKIILF
jgi:hypothetical protein